MLSAYNQEGKLILLTEKGRNDLRQLKRDSYYCPVCQEPLILKIGQIRIPHFAHKQNSEHCDRIVAEGESTQHLIGKKQLYLYLKKQGITVKLEEYIPSIRQRPDILYKFNGKWHALEYQCTPISLEMIQARTNGYKKLNIIPLWIVGVPFKKYQPNLFEVNEFHWSVATNFEQGTAIVWYDPKSKYFFFLENLIPLTTTKVFAHLRTHPLQSFKDRKYKIPHVKPFQLKNNLWLQEQRKWLQNKVHYSTTHDPFLQIVYLSGHNPFLLPVICGIPVKDSYFFKTPPFVWQYYIYNDSLKLLQNGQRISLKSAIHQFRIRIKQKLVLLRHFPLLDNNRWEKAINHYFSLLERMGYFIRVNNEEFILKRSIRIPKTVEEKMQIENELYSTINLFD